MELLLTSNGLTNPSLVQTFDNLVDKEPADTTIAFIPTAANVERGNKDWLIRTMHELTDRDYNVDIVELTALSGRHLEAAVRAADILFVGGGNVFYLSYWMQWSGFTDLLPQLGDIKYVGVSAGSMVATPNLSLSSQALAAPDDYRSGNYEAFVPGGEAAEATLHLVDFLFRPHLNATDFPLARLDVIEHATQNSVVPVYALDDQSAIHVRNNHVEVISEGEWHLLPATNTISA